MNQLEKIIREIIASQGAISLAAYMELALQHPEHGYYRVRDPLGRTGDFITAPEVSQMFGEIIGIWCVEAWKDLGKPDAFALIELGPGRGTMMRDLLRATAHVKGFHDAKKLFLVDSDKALHESQVKNLSVAAPRYIDDIGQAPFMPALIVANEFFDALPVRQFEQTFRGWCERMVTLENNALVVALRPLEADEQNLIPLQMKESVPGTVYEISPKAQNIMCDLARHIGMQKGAMLLIDYGYGAASGTATIQAVSDHERADIFDRPGEVDLTAHVDFSVLATVAEGAGLRVSPLIGQGDFLKNLGIEIRADALKAHANPAQIIDIDAALYRLTDEAQMGSLFKVMEVKG